MSVGGAARGEDDDDEEEEAPGSAAPTDPAEERVFAALERVLDEWLVTGMHRAGARKFVKDKICAQAGEEDCRRARQWLLLRMNGKVWEHGQPLMCRAPENVPGLRSFHVWPRNEAQWLAGVEARHGEILEELLAARGSGGGGGGLSGFQPYRDPASSGHKGRLPADGLGVEGVDVGAWNVLYLYLNHKKFEDNCARFPATVRAINEAFPRQYSHAFFSALTPGSHILKHHGPSNRMLRVWLPICGLEGFRLRVGDTIVQPNAGEAFIWDHSFEHEAWHEGDETRVVLIVDIWHPDLTEPEVKFLGTLQSCRLRAGRALVERAAAEQEERGVGRDPQDATYFEIVEKARHLLTDDDWWIVRAERDPTTRPT
mmetsp:Transcript_58696/g.191416  ORF Transcript_58696/g.191416 Transcript_58696/m.191416 type:complete len:371 (-) Transcript_58696:32-1144(-)|eukprot:CAMPEP_0203871672 /NCGR_PEP_ID=MMETSP0359-20131031/18857_1 /ASSEMBLY_ACC=CAM_ASM_000338 /TAXON_ID=268821 /ORGANISM="Scrippsiella Hangoei, Strain SHTV-5" /LENGTH=370 /DNA_ID=CAMNT_0050790347 /DNA_START=72 /DNA_END=1184 /DNA_ORIENTATION=-